AAVRRRRPPRAPQQGADPRHAAPWVTRPHQGSRCRSSHRAGRQAYSPCGRTRSRQPPLQERQGGLMATLKRWSRTVGAQRGNRIRVYEREPGGKLYAAVWDPERHKYTQTGLGPRDRERALRDVGELVRLRESGEDLSGPLQLGTMVARYLAESTHTRDGSLKTAPYMKGCAQFATYVIEWFGAEPAVSRATP